jgi:dTDP-4-dehydrorhamnose 3,5-epimerase-like enzyme
MSVEIVELPNHGDERGLSFSNGLWKEFLQQVKDIHIATIRPGAVRGNHYHKERREALFVLHNDQWSFHWESHPGGSVLERRFRGSGCVMITVEPGIGHGMRNDGGADLLLLAITNADYDPKNPDAHHRAVITTHGQL